MTDDIKNSDPDFSGPAPSTDRPTSPRRDAGVTYWRPRRRRLLAVPDVTSVGIGLGPVGRRGAVVGVVVAGVSAHLPQEIKGVPVVVTVTGEVDALPRR